MIKSELRRTLKDRRNSILQSGYAAVASSAITDSIKKLDSEFHEQIYSYCGSKTLNTMLSELHRKVKRYRKTSVSNPERAILAVKEHREIFEAIAAHDAKLAEELTAKHIKNARESIMKECE